MSIFTSNTHLAVGYAHAHAADLLREAEGRRLAAQLRATRPGRRGRRFTRPRLTGGAVAPVACC